MTWTTRLAPALATLALAAALPALAQAPTPQLPPEPTPFPSVRNEDPAYSAGLAARAAKLAKLSPVTDALQSNPPAGDWLVWRRAYDGLGFSPLAQINKTNVAKLAPAWAWSLPQSENEITPLVHDGVLFIASGQRVQALDAVTGDRLWQYTRPLLPGVNGATAITKNVALSGDKLFVSTPDKHLVALEAKTGKLVWDHEVVADGPGAPRVTGGPVVARGKVMIGVTGCNNYKGGCYILALDEKTGAEAWRFHTIARPDEPGGDSWNGAPLDERFGGAVWLPGTYDAALNLVYWGTGQTYNSASLLVPRPGQTAPSKNDALYTDSTLALNPDTGKLVWHYQHMSRDVWDMDWVFERSLLTLPVNGKDRKVAVTAGKLAIFDVLDRETGEYLFSKDLGIQNLVSAIDPKTGHKTVASEMAPQMGEQKLVCPHAGGARNWMSTAYDARTHILYVPMVESCMNFTRRVRTAAQVAAGGSDLGWVVRAKPGSDGNVGRLDAIDLVTRKTVWSVRRRAPQSAALVATAGGLVFEGTRDRGFRALDAATGKTLWQTKLAAQASSFPITYAVNGRQYVAVVAGGGGSIDGTWPALTPEIDDATMNAPVLQVFALPSP